MDVLKLVRYILQSRNSRSFFSICVYVQSSLQMHACPTNSAAKKSSLIYRTLFYQTIIRSPSSVASRTINLVSITIWWSDVQLPEEWKVRDEIPLETQEYESHQRIKPPDQAARTCFPPTQSGQSTQFHYGLNTIISWRTSDFSVQFPHSTSSS